MRPASELLVLLSLVDLSPAEVQRAESLASELGDWAELCDLAEHGATAPLVWASLCRLGLDQRVPADVRSRFEETSSRVRAANEARLGAGRDLLRAMSQRHIDVIVLKGIYFAETIYKDPGYKKMNDIDILVRKRDLDAIFDIYEERGMFCAGELVGGNPRKQEKFSHHAPPYFDRDLKLMVGTHWGLITPLSSYKLDYDKMWARCQPFNFYGIPLFGLSPADNLHHLCVHLPYYKCGVRELADIYNLLRQRTIDWDDFLGDVRSAGTQQPVYHALSLAHTLHPMPAVARVVAQLAPEVSSYCLKDVAAKTQSVDRLLRLRSTHMSRIEKAYSKIAMTEDGGEKLSAYLSMWRNILMPPPEEVARMNARDELSGVRGYLDRAITPWRIYKVFERDVGGKIFAAVVTKAAVDVALTNLKRPFVGGGKNLEARTRELGVSSQKVAELLEALE